MSPLRRSRAGKRLAVLNAGAMEPRDQVRRQERAVAWRAHDPFNLRSMIGGPIESGQDPCQGAWKIRDAVGHDTQTCVSEAARITVRVEDHLTALRNESGEDAFKNGFFTDANAPFVTAGHAACAAAGEDETESGWDVHARFVISCAVPPVPIFGDTRGRRRYVT